MSLLLNALKHIEKARQHQAALPAPHVQFPAADLVDVLHALVAEGTIHPFQELPALQQTVEPTPLSMVVPTAIASLPAPRFTPAPFEIPATIVPPLAAVLPVADSKSVAAINSLAARENSQAHSCQEPANCEPVSVEQSAFEQPALESELTTDFPATIPFVIPPLDPQEIAALTQVPPRITRSASSVVLPLTLGAAQSRLEPSPAEPLPTIEIHPQSTSEANTPQKLEQNPAFLTTDQMQPLAAASSQLEMCVPAQAIASVPPLRLRNATDDIRSEEQDQIALKNRLSELRIEGLCENLASQLGAIALPNVLFVPVVAMFELPQLVQAVSNQLARKLETAPKILDLAKNPHGALIDPGAKLARDRRDSWLLLMAESVASLSLAPWISQCDAIYLLVDLRTTSRRATDHAVQQLQALGGNLLGAVVLE